MTERIGIISDVHGNLPAFTAVLEDAKARGIGQFVIAGDYCLSGAWPDGCIEKLKNLPNAHIIRGNEERYLENLIGKDQSTWTDGQMQISYWNYRNIRKENLDYVLNLPHTIDYVCNGVSIHVAHASDAFLGECEFGKFGPALLAKQYAEVEVTPEMLHDDIHKLLDNDPEVQNKLKNMPEGVYIFGHSHVQWSYQAKDKNVWLVNPGSCGLPLDCIRGSVPYDILSITDAGEVQLEEVRVTFSKEAYVEQLKQTTQFTQARVWTEVIFRELLTAQEHLTFFLQFAEQYAQKIGDTRRPYCVETWEAAYESWAREQNVSNGTVLVAGQRPAAVDTFLEMHPGFFERDYVRERGDEVASEMMLALRKFDEGCYVKTYPENVTFGYYNGSLEELKKAVAEVIPHWVDFFSEKSRVYCGFIDGEIACFCIIENFGEHEVNGETWNIGGPGCVGTLPAYRNRGLGLTMVKHVTKILQDEGYTHSYIHFTYEVGWYAKLGYKTFLRWNGRGVVWTGEMDS